MFHFGFSYVGLIFLLMLFIPNGIWTKNQPEGYEKYSQNENKVLATFERIGQVLATIFLLIFSDTNVRKSYWVVFLALAFLLMVLYDICWVRYFRSKKTMLDYYGCYFKIPVPLASLPVVSMFLLGIYGSNIFLIVASIILGIGHIGIHLGHRNEAWKDLGVTPKKPSIAVRVIRVIIIMIVSLIFAVISIVIAVRNITYITHASKATSGVVESHYIEIGGEEQYIFERGNDINNPVIIYLHGGPSSPDSYETYVFTDYLVDNYTVISWDQRGCGRTYLANNDGRSPDSTVDFDRAVQDLDELVDYALEKYEKNEVIIMGWSYGTILGTRYITEHPEKVFSYIGIGQFVNMISNEQMAYEVALELSYATCDGTSELEQAYERYQETGALPEMLALRNLTYPYLSRNQIYAKNLTFPAIFSPYFGMDDFRWFVLQLGDVNSYIPYNQALFDYLTVNIREFGTEYDVPVYYITGSEDYTCNPTLVGLFIEELSAPEMEFYIMDGCGHGCHYDNASEFANMINSCLGEE